MPTAPGMPVPIPGTGYEIADHLLRLETLGLSASSIDDLNEDEVSTALERIAARAERLGMCATTRYGYPVSLVPKAEASESHRAGHRASPRSTSAKQ